MSVNMFQHRRGKLSLDVSYRPSIFNLLILSHDQYFFGTEMNADTLLENSVGIKARALIEKITGNCHHSRQAWKVADRNTVTNLTSISFELSLLSRGYLGLRFKNKFA